MVLTQFRYRSGGADPGSVLELWTSLMFKRQQTRPRGPLIHADAPVRAQRPGENRIMTAAVQVFWGSSDHGVLASGRHFGFRCAAHDVTVCR
jgi:hypothetical protein